MIRVPPPTATTYAQVELVPLHSPTTQVRRRSEAEVTYARRRSSETLVAMQAARRGSADEGTTPPRPLWRRLLCLTG